MQKKLHIKFYCVFDYFPRSYEVTEFSIIKLYFDVSGVTDASEHAKHANCSLHVNFLNFLLMLLYFMVKKYHFKQKLLLWPQVLFKVSLKLNCIHLVSFSN